MMCDYIKRKQLHAGTDIHGWIVYSSQENSISPHYIDLYVKACERYQMSAELGICDTACVQSQAALQKVRKQIQQDAPSFVINRTRDCRISQLFEQMNIPVFNNSQTVRLGNDKALAYQYMADRSVPVMPVFQYDSDKEPPWYPAVIKSRSGHGGTQVYWIQDQAAWIQWREEHIFKSRKADAGFTDSRKEFENSAENYIIQQASDEPGRDVRVYIVGNKITAAVLRTSDTDFRSNYCLGGTAALYTLTDKERKLAVQAVRGLEIGMAGIDFIFHNGEMVFNEIEDMAGARALYALSDYDIADDYIRYIREKICC